MIEGSDQPAESPLLTDDEMADAKLTDEEAEETPTLSIPPQLLMSPRPPLPFQTTWQFGASESPRSGRDGATAAGGLLMSSSETEYPSPNVDIEEVIRRELEALTKVTHRQVKTERSMGEMWRETLLKLSATDQSRKRDTAALVANIHAAVTRLEETITQSSMQSGEYTDDKTMRAMDYTLRTLQPAISSTAKAVEAVREEQKKKTTDLAAMNTRIEAAKQDQAVLKSYVNASEKITNEIHQYAREATTRLEGMDDSMDHIRWEIKTARNQADLDRDNAAHAATKLMRMQEDLTRRVGEIEQEIDAKLSRNSREMEEWSAKWEKQAERQARKAHEELEEV